jgi:exodeoxyribonuclease VII large subunit
MTDALTISQITRHVRERLRSDPTLQDVTVTGEVSNFTRASSGHWYFTLKDAESQLKGVMWRGNTEKNGFVPSNGMSVIAEGSVDVYESRGEYQLIADKVRAAGLGDLYAQFERLKARLDGEGLFAPERKRPLPAFPKLIGIVTSADAAAFQDVQNVLRRRFPLVEVLLSATPVQGASAPPKIVTAIQRLYDTPIDLMIVCRGGGSIEDLWAFNDEAVARAIAASPVPVISGVGHEIDFTIADFAADVRAPTPSAAAELATPNIDDLRALVQNRRAALDAAMQQQISEQRIQVVQMLQQVQQASPQRLIVNQRQRVDDAIQRMQALQQHQVSLLRAKVTGSLSALNAFNPATVLARGYALVTKSDDGQIVNAKNTKAGEGITLRFADGELKARIEDKNLHESYKRTLF